MDTWNLLEFKCVNFKIQGETSSQKLTRTGSNSRRNKSKNKQMYCIALKGFCIRKQILNTMKRQSTKWERAFISIHRKKVTPEDTSKSFPFFSHSPLPLCNLSSSLLYASSSLEVTMCLQTLF